MAFACAPVPRQRPEPPQITLVVPADAVAAAGARLGLVAECEAEGAGPAPDWLAPELAEWAGRPLPFALGDCAPVRAACTAAERVERHGIAALAARWREWCPLAGECERLASVHALSERRLAEIAPVPFRQFAADGASEAPPAVPVFVEWLDSLPEGDPVRCLVEEAALNRYGLLALQCRHARELPMLLAETGHEMLRGHGGAGRWLAAELPRLVSDPAAAADRLAPPFPAYQALLAAGDRFRSETPDEDKWKRIRLAMAAWRGAVPPWESSFVLVQVPQAWVELYLDSRRVLRVRAVVGSARREKDPVSGSLEFLYRTLPLNSAITALVVNPEWRIPTTIVSREIEPRLASDPDYLERHNIRVERFESGAIRYVQEAGELNVMGRLKFRFPNRHGYFLHDSPDKRLFRKGYRLHSHGCVRVDKAAKLAERLLARDKGWNFDQLRKALKRGETREVTLTTPVPIHILYSTAAADDDGHLIFSEDFYELEE